MNSKKIKSQKIAAISLIIFPMFILISHLGKTDVNRNELNFYGISISLLVLIFCGISGLRNSLRKLKEQNI